MITTTSRLVLAQTLTSRAAAFATILPPPSGRGMSMKMDAFPATRSNTRTINTTSTQEALAVPLVPVHQFFPNNNINDETLSQASPSSAKQLITIPNFINESLQN